MMAWIRSLGIVSDPFYRSPFLFTVLLIAGGGFVALLICAGVALLQGHRP